ncbi:transmembrane protein 270-like [Candoia aspera]|uniref:transmembrane protein 270-like n=1 Tax=Candoia aspera TaxID=51853 RepID=UPI002FD7F5B7
MEPKTRPSSRFPEPGSSLPTTMGKSLQGAVQGGLRTLYLHLLSLREGILSWYFCLKQIQWDLLCWIQASMELTIDFFFCWAQNALLASMMLLLVAWQVHNGAKEYGWRSFLRRLVPEEQLTQRISLLKSCYWNLENLLIQVAWTLVCCFIWVVSCIVQTLEASYKQAAQMARDQTEEDKKETAGGLLMTPHSALLPRQELLI